MLLVRSLYVRRRCSSERWRLNLLAAGGEKARSRFGLAACSASGKLWKSAIPNRAPRAPRAGGAHRPSERPATGPRAICGACREWTQWPTTGTSRATRANQASFTLANALAGGAPSRARLSQLRPQGQRSQHEHPPRRRCGWRRRSSRASVGDDRPDRARDISPRRPPESPAWRTRRRG